jgi:hypothetical protein
MRQIFHLLLPFLKAKAKHVYLAKLKAKLYHAKDSDGPAAQTPVCMSAQGSTTLLQVDGGRLQERRQEVEHEIELEPYEGVYEDYLKLAIQFGYIVLFAAAFPLAPILALVNNQLEMRTDSFALTRGCKRVVREHAARNGPSAASIGSWFTVFDALGVLGILTNSMLIGFVGSQLIEYLEWEDGDEGYELDQDKRILNKRFIWATVIIEHIILMLRYFMGSAISSVPAWVGATMELLAAIGAFPECWTTTQSTVVLTKAG